MIAPWNSSSRGPVGLVSTVSTTPNDTARDTAGICSGRSPQSSNSIRFAVGTTLRTSASTSTPSSGRRAALASTIAIGSPAAGSSANRAIA